MEAGLAARLCRCPLAALFLEALASHFHVRGFGGDLVRELTQQVGHGREIVRDRCHVQRALGKCRLLVHRVGNVRACKLDQPGLPLPAHK